MQTLFLLPGALSSKNQFENLQTALSSSFHVVCLDLPGHGMEPYGKQAGNVPKMAAEVLRKFREELGGKPANLFGHSLGGYLGLYLALHVPGSINRLFTLGTKWHWDPETAIRETLFLRAEKMMEKVPAYVESLIKMHGPDWITLLETIRTLMLDLGENRYLDPEKVSSVDVPVRIGLGDRDQMVTLAETQAVYKALKQGEMQVFPKTPHPFERADTKMIADAITTFFSRE